METIPRTFDIRMAALDRAINRLQSNPEASPDEVVLLAEKFYRYLIQEVASR